MGLPLIHVDAFTDTPFAGNPAAVCLLDRPREPGWMQAVAAEMNLPETAFVVAEANGFGLRWFTPTIEVDLCGHATLAAAHALWQERRLPSDATARFHTRSGVLTAALGVTAKWTGRNRLDWLVEVDGAATVRALTPDLTRLATVPTRGVIVTAAADDARFDFVSRFFAPRAGLPEDSATGSSHCTLVPYWSRRLGKRELHARQLSARGGEMFCRNDGDRVLIGGQVAEFLRGHIHV